MHPILFQVGDTPIFTFSAFLVLGTLVAVAWTRWCTSAPESGEALWAPCAVWLIGGVTGSLVFRWITQLWVEDSSLPWLSGGGLEIGGLLGGFAFVCLLARPLAFSPLNSLDRLTPGLGLGLAIGRLGSWLQGQAYGAPAEAPWGIEVAYAKGSAVPQTIEHISRYPVAYWLSISGFAIFVFATVASRRSHRPGRIFALGAIIWFTSRLLTDPVRGDLVRYSGMSLTQWISSVLLFGTIVFVIKTRGESLTSAREGVA